MFHSELEVKPRPNVPYHCDVCHLDLVLDSAGEHFIVSTLVRNQPEKA
jgi:hypothetical protein